MTVVSFLMSLTSGLLLPDHLPKSYVLGDLNSNHAVSPHADTKQLCQFASYELCAISNVTRSSSIYTFQFCWHMPLNKYACHIAYICSTALLL